MIGRIKFQVRSPKTGRWRTVYVKKNMLRKNVDLLLLYGFETRWGGR
jgi:hypothetical protein